MANVAPLFAVQFLSKSNEPVIFLVVNLEEL